MNCFSLEDVLTSLARPAETGLLRSVSLLYRARGRAAYAQTGTAALVGEVTDSQKQVIPGAT